MADVRYAIKRGNGWLQETAASPTYVRSANSPTMGTRHTVSEYQTVWGKEPVLFERLTVTNCIKVLLEEYRWGDLKPMDFKVVVMYGGEDG